LARLSQPCRHPQGACGALRHQCSSTPAAAAAAVAAAAHPQRAHRLLALELALGAAVGRRGVRVPPGVWQAAQLGLQPGKVSR
jgi:hypothetical protein